MTGIKIFLLVGIAVLANAAILSWTHASEDILENADIAERAKSLQTASIRENDLKYGEVWSDFLTVAFSDQIWNESKDVKSNREQDLAQALEWYASKNWDLANKDFKAEYDSQMDLRPWIAPYIYRPNGWPDNNVVHKWEQGITIGLGWPGFSPAYIQRQKRNKANLGAGSNKTYDDIQESLKASYPLIIEEVSKLLPAIEAATGMPVDLIPPNDPKDTTDDYARIRIVPTASIAPRTLRSGTPYVMSVSDYFPMLWGAVPFETSNLNYMDGFLLPRENNALGLAVCNIDTVNATDELLRILVRECVIRSLGLPDISKSEADSILKGTTQSINSDAPLSESDGSNFRNLSVTSYDLMQLKLLYCPSISSGMSKNDVIRIITQESECPLK